jgi:hypothetical protein
MSLLQVLTPFEWFAFVGVPCILMTMGWASVKANEAWLRRVRERDLHG